MRTYLVLHRTKYGDDYYYFQSKQEWEANLVAEEGDMPDDRQAALLETLKIDYTLRDDEEIIIKDIELDERPVIDINGNKLEYPRRGMMIREILTTVPKEETGTLMGRLANVTAIGLLTDDKLKALYDDLILKKK